MYSMMAKWIFMMIAVGLTFQMTDGLAVMSVDLGSEYMKVAIVKPGIPMEIVLNKESGRKTPVAVSMRNGERLFSDAAKSTSVRFPKAAYIYVQDLLAKSLDNPIVKRHQERFPFYDLEEDPDTKTVYFRHSEDDTYSPEELLAMVLEHAKDIAEKFAEQPVNDAVITVPAYFNQAERRALVRAGETAGLKVLQIMNDNSAVALNYGVFRRKSFNATAVYYLFFDMGATSTTATVVAYQEVKAKNKVTGILEKDPQLTIKGVGFDRNLGGLELQLRLRDHLANKFNEQKKTPLDIRTSPRAMAKLFKEAGRLKHVLSANTEHSAQIEGVFEDVDFKVRVTRDEFEAMSADLFEKVGGVVEEALRTSDIHMDEIKEVILMGGGTRVPKVQAHLQKAIGREELGKSVNTDEAAALGAVYQAAHLSKGFKVKKFIVKEATIYPIQVNFPSSGVAIDEVEFERAKKNDVTGESEKKMVARTLFGRNNPYPQNKVMTFNKHTKDFEFEVNYGDLDFMAEGDKQSFGEKSLYQIQLSGVEEAYGKHKDEADSKGIKAHFKMENSGILELDKVEFVFEKQPPAEPEKPEEEKSTLEKLGNAFSGLFGGADSPPAPEDQEAVEEGTEIKAEKEEDEKKEEKTTDETKETEEKPTEKESETKDDSKSESGDSPATDEEEKEDKVKDEDEKEDEKEESEENTQKDVDNTESSDQGKEDEEKTEPETPSADEKEAPKTEEKSEEKTEEKPAESEGKEEKKEGDDKEGDKAKKDKKKEDKKEEKPKAVIYREDVKAEMKFMDLPEPSKEAVRASKKKIKDLKAKDEEKLLLEKAKNDLETFIIDAQDKLYQDIYTECSTEEQREKLTAKLSEASDWLYELEEDAERELYAKTLKDLKKATKKLWGRVQEKQDRPKAIEAINSIMNYSAHFLLGMKNFTGEVAGDQPFTTTEYETLEKLVKDTKEWNDTIMAEQAATPDWEEPKVRMEDFGVKVQALDREIKYLTNKAKSFRPKVKKEDANSTKTDETAETKGSKEEKTKEKSKDDDSAEKQEAGDNDSAEKQEADDSAETQDTGDDDSAEKQEADDSTESEQTEETPEQEEEVLQLGGDEEAEDSKPTDAPTEQTTEKTEPSTHDPQDL